jgi:hypothetical protein
VCGAARAARYDPGTGRAAEQLGRWAAAEFIVNLDFFAVRDDFVQLFEFLWQETDCRVAESYSLFDAELRWFDFFDDIERAYQLGDDPHGSGMAVGLALWSPSVMPKYMIERIKLDRRRVKGHAHRYTIKGSGLITLIAGGKSASVITRSRMGHISEKRAAAYGTHEGVDWPALVKLGRKIEYRVRSRIAAAKTNERSLPILPAAFQLAISGTELRETDRAPWRYTIAPPDSA